MTLLVDISGLKMSTTSLHLGAKDVIAKVFVELHAVRHFYILANYVFLCSGERFFYKLIWHSKQSFAKLMLWLVFLFHYVQFVSQGCQVIFGSFLWAQ